MRHRSLTVQLRPLSIDDTDGLAVVERAASQRFRDVGYPNVADDDPFTADELAPYAEEGRAWVAVDERGVSVGYLLADVVDGNAHVEQVTVHPAHQGAGIGRALLERVATWAASHRLPAITLTTYSDVPWNRPLYEHLGFDVLDDAEIGPELRRLRQAEADHGLDPAVRVCMRRPATSSSVA